MNRLRTPLSPLLALSLWAACGEPPNRAEPRGHGDVPATAPARAPRPPQPAPALTARTPEAPASPFATPAASGAEPTLEPADTSLAPTARDAPDRGQTEEAPKRVPSAAEVKLARFQLALGVQDREPVDPADVFRTDDERIYAFLHFENGDAAPYEVEVHFEPVDGPPSRYGVTLKVGSGPRYRTWAYTAIRRPPGRYRCVVRTTAGEEIAAREFEIQDAASFF